MFQGFSMLSTLNAVLVESFKRNRPPGSETTDCSFAPPLLLSVQDELKSTAAEVAALKGQIALVKTAALASQAESLPGGGSYLVAELDGVAAADLQGAALSLQQKLGERGAVVLLSPSPDGKVSMVAAFGPTVVADGLQAGKFIGGVAKVCGGGGGGRPNVAQAGGKDASKVPEALALAREQLLAHFGA
jgi:alanyl-tRNA synthetase